jgi:hypothetical protein
MWVYGHPITCSATSTTSSTTSSSMYAITTTLTYTEGECVAIRTSSALLCTHVRICAQHHTPGIPESRDPWMWALQPIPSSSYIPPSVRASVLWLPSLLLYYTEGVCVCIPYVLAVLCGMCYSPWMEPCSQPLISLDPWIHGMWVYGHPIT